MTRKPDQNSSGRPLIGLLALTVSMLWTVPVVSAADPLAPNYRFVRIATAGKPAPGGGTFAEYFEPYGVNRNNDALFVSDTTDGKEAVYFRRMGKILKIARTGDAAPGGGTFGVASLGRVPLSNTGDIAFGFRLSTETTPRGVGAGEYRYHAATKKLSALVVPEVTTAPGGGKFAGVYFNTGMNNVGDVVFPGIVHGYDIDPSTAPGCSSSDPCAGLGTGVFRADKNNNLSRVVVPGDAAPQGRKFDYASHAWINDYGDVSFGGHLQGDECIAGGPQTNAIFCSESVYMKSAAGVIRSIAHQGRPAPGGGIFRRAFGPVINNKGHIVFIGDLTPAPDTGKDNGVFLYSGGVARAVAVPGDNMVGGGKFVSSSGTSGFYDINEDGEVSFAARLSQDVDNDGWLDSAIYVFTPGQGAAAAEGQRAQGTFKLVLRTGSFIPGIGKIRYLGIPPFAPGFIPALAMGSMMNENNRMLVWATTTDGLSVLLLAIPQA